VVRRVETQKTDELPRVTGGPLVVQQVDERVDEEQRERVESRDQEPIDRDQLQLAPLSPGDKSPGVADSSYEPEVFVRQSDRPFETILFASICTALHTIGKPP
jgi:hypothetical protein